MPQPFRILLLTLALAPSVAAAQVTLGLRAGYGLPAGDAYELTDFGTFKQKEFAKGMVPIQVEAAWRLTPSISAGLYYAYGFGMKGSKIEDLCATPGSSCGTPSFHRFGAEATYRFLEVAGLRPWAAVGAGMEIGGFNVKKFTFAPPPVPAADLDGSFRGWSLNLQGGLAWKATEAFALGPYVQVDVARYTVQHVTLSGQGTVAGGGIDSPKTHEWITLGLSGSYDL